MKSKENECSYHSCNKKARLKKCNYCSKFFCKEHIASKPAGQPRFKDSGYEAKKFMEEFHRKGGHPCMSYNSHWYDKIRKDKEGSNGIINFLDRNKDTVIYNSHKNYESKSEKSKFKDNISFPHLRIPKIRVNKLFKSLILACLTLIIAYNFESSLWLILEAVTWSYSSVILYAGIFRWANRINLADDLSFFGLSFLGGVVSVLAIWLGFSALIGSILVKNSLSLTLPIIILLVGLFFFGAFIAFRTNRRHHVVGVWRA